MWKRGSLREEKKWKKSMTKIIYIYSEWEATEVHYFNAKWKDIRNPLYSVRVEWTGKNTISLIEYVILQHPKDKRKYWDDEYRVVFDADPKTWSKDKGKRKENFDNAIDKALCDWIKVAYSHECFDLWYLLHFEDYNNTAWRKEYYEKLTGYFSKLDKSIKRYEDEKWNKKLYSLLSLGGSEEEAIKRAKKLESMHDKSENSKYSAREPSTKVFELIEHLNSLKSE
jgi:hypothetical protein